MSVRALHTSKYTNLVNTTKKGRVLHVFVMPTGLQKRITPFLQSISAGYWLRRDYPSGPSLIGPIAFPGDKRDSIVPSGVAIRSWKTFWGERGFRVAPIIVRAAHVNLSKELRVKEILRKVMAGSRGLR
jgi:hypothetical protein